jgi:hypothetical protein
LSYISTKFCGITLPKEPFNLTSVANPGLKNMGYLTSFGKNNCEPLSKLINLKD